MVLAYISVASWASARWSESFEIVRRQKRHLTVIANDTASPGGIGGLLAAGRVVSEVVASHPSV
jgi:hypothetical protein